MARAIIVERTKTASASFARVTTSCESSAYSSVSAQPKAGSREVALVRAARTTPPHCPNGYASPLAPSRNNRSTTTRTPHPLLDHTINRRLHRRPRKCGIRVTCPLDADYVDAASGNFNRRVRIRYPRSDLRRMRAHASSPSDSSASTTGVVHCGLRRSPSTAATKNIGAPSPAIPRSLVCGWILETTTANRTARQPKITSSCRWGMKRRIR